VKHTCIIGHLSMVFAFLTLYAMYAAPLDEKSPVGWFVHDALISRLVNPRRGFVELLPHKASAIRGPQMNKNDNNSFPEGFSIQRDNRKDHADAEAAHNAKRGAGRPGNGTGHTSPTLPFLHLTTTRVRAYPKLAVPFLHYRRETPSVMTVPLT
jgi:hypothetical protein